MKPSKTRIQTRHFLLAAVAFAPAVAPAQEEVKPAAELPPTGAQVAIPEPRKLNRLGLNLRFGMNISASFKNKDAVSLSNPGPPTGGGIDRFYDDGYVRPDATYPNSGGVTAFWGYENPSQVGATDLFMHSADPLSESDSKSSEDDVPLGVELTYTRELGLTRYGSWGFEAGFGWMPVDICDNDALSGTVNLLQDAFGLGDPPLAPPLAPFYGSYNGTQYGLLDEAPNQRIVAPVPATASGRRELEADLYTFRIGPYFNVPISPRFGFQLGAGLATAFVDSTFRYSETLTTEAGSTATQSAKDHETDFLLGPYVSGHFGAQLSERFSALVGAQWQGLGSFHQQAGGKEATLDLDQAIFIYAGAGYSF